MDTLALSAFTVDNLLSVWIGPGEPGMTGAYSVLPFVALSQAVRSPGLSMATRLFLIQVAFTVFFEYFKDYHVCGRDAGISAKALSFCPRKTFWSRMMCARACNTCIGLYWTILKYRESDYPGF
jgi:hypothetical protein